MLLSEDECARMKNSEPGMVAADLEWTEILSTVRLRA